MKYIQETDWFKVGRAKAVKALDKECHEAIGDAIIEAVEKTCLISKGGAGKGRGSVSC